MGLHPVDALASTIADSIGIFCRAAEEGQRRQMSLFDRARGIAPSIEIAPKSLSFLHRQSRDQITPRTEWENGVRLATAVEYLMDQAVRERNADGFAQLIDERSAEAALEQMQACKGLLLLTCHSGFRTINRIAFRSFQRGGHATILTRLKIENDRRTALFETLRALQNGMTIVMAPDGAMGRQSDALTIFGQPVPVGDGMAFLAFETGCQTAFFSMRLAEEHFVPSIAFGPRRQTSETRLEFAARINRFYATSIEGLMTGDPRSIVLNHRWQQFILGAQRGPLAAAVASILPSWMGLLAKDARRLLQFRRSPRPPPVALNETRMQKRSTARGNAANPDANPDQ